MSRLKCQHCGLIFSGPGFSPDGKTHFCCCGCYFVSRVVGHVGGDGLSSWIQLRLGIGAFFTMYVMMISLVLYIEPASTLGASAVRGLRWSLLVFSTPAVAILGGTFFLASVRQAIRGRLSTDALIVTGAAAAYGVSAWHVVAGSGHIYFDTATMLLLIVTVGRLLESTARARASRALHEAPALIPATARVMRGGAEVEVPSDELETGDSVVVERAECFPADGVLASGTCLVNESAFTGESRPRECLAGDHVLGGSEVCRGSVEVEVRAVGSETLAGRIEAMVREAQQQRAPVERLAERVSSVFVPFVWSVALAAVAYWGLAQGDMEKGMLAGLAVLVVACPCAMGLATPLAVCLAIARAARMGVLVRSGEILERLPRLTRVFFDKTGTLTEGVGSLAYFDANGASTATIDLDPARTGARAAVQSLVASGLHVALISGDRPEAVSRLSADLGISESHPQCSPEDKIELIAGAHKRGDVVAMVGDGVNDAPALAQADVGIAIGSGTDIARNTSDIILIGDNLTRVPLLLDLARQMVHTIRWNLVWAFGYNAAMIVLAFVGVLHPLIAAIAMLVSSATVVGNSLKLAR